MTVFRLSLWFNGRIIFNGVSPNYIIVENNNRNLIDLAYDNTLDHIFIKDLSNINLNKVYKIAAMHHECVTVSFQP